MQAPSPSAPPQKPAWDQAAFINAMNNFTLNNEGTDWIFDSGASLHMSSNMNLLSACFPSPFSTITIGDGSVKRDNEIENIACVHAGLRVDYIWTLGRFVQGGRSRSGTRREA